MACVCQNLYLFHYNKDNNMGRKNNKFLLEDDKHVWEVASCDDVYDEDEYDDL